MPGATNDREVIRRAVAGCDGVLTVLVPWGVQHYASGTAQAVLDYAEPGARLVFSCGWHISRDGKDVYSWQLRYLVPIFGWMAKLFRAVDLDDQVEATQRIFASDTRWTVVRGSDLEEGESQGLPVWSRHVGDPILASNLTRRIDFALFMVEALTDDALVHEAPAIVGRADALGAGAWGRSAERDPCTAPCASSIAGRQRSAVTGGRAVDRRCTSPAACSPIASIPTATTPPPAAGHQ